MSEFFFSASICLLLISYSLFLFNVVAAHRRAIEIIIGGGGPPQYGYPPSPPEPECPPPPPPPCPPPPPPPCPPPPPPPCPPPPPPPPSPPKPTRPPAPSPTRPKRPAPSISISGELIQAGKVIRAFGSTIGNDPFHIVDTWQGDNPCNYKGVICAKFPKNGKQEVAGIKFNGYQFNGKKNKTLELTNFIEKLPKVTFFHANSINFSGLVPPKIRLLEFLFEFDLSNKKFEGAFPMGVLTPPNLTFLDVRFNQLMGPLPPQVFPKDLDVLFLNNNQFTGNIHDTIGRNRALYLTLARNNFTGSIPSTIGQAVDRLVEILLLGNQLSGCLPHQIGLLRKTRVLYASQTR